MKNANLFRESGAEKFRRIVRHETVCAQPVSSMQAGGLHMHSSKNCTGLTQIVVGIQILAGILSQNPGPSRAIRANPVRITFCVLERQVLPWVALSASLSGPARGG
jgi:hypothetical protein